MDEETIEEWAARRVRELVRRMRIAAAAGIVLW